MNSPAPDQLARARRYLSDGLLTRALDYLEELTSGCDFGNLDARDGMRMRFLVLHNLGMWQELAGLCKTTLSNTLPGAYPDVLSSAHGYLGVAELRLGLADSAEDHLRAAIHIATWELRDQREALSHRSCLAV